MNTTSRRSGFTLVEMLIVLGVIATVAAIFIPIVLNMSDRNQVPKGASMLENALSLAKARAVAEKRPNGIRILLTSDNLRRIAGGAAFAWYDQIQYIEDPGDYVEASVWGFADIGPVPAAVPPVPAPPVRNSTQPFWTTTATPSPGSLPQGFDDVSIASGPFTFNATTASGTGSVTFNRSRLLFGPISMTRLAPDSNQWTGLSGVAHLSQRYMYNWFSADPIAVQPGDRIEITGVGELYTVVAVSIDQAIPPGLNNTNVNISSTGNAIRVPVIVVDRDLSGDISPVLNGRPNFRIIRQPRVIPSLSPVKLPQDVVIDFTPSRQTFLGIPTGDLDNSPTPSIYMSNVSAGVSVTAITGITTATPNLVAPDYIDIMFSHSGEILPTTQTFLSGANLGQFTVGSSGLIALWIHSRGSPDLWAARQITAAQGNADNQAIVAINGRTGFIGSYPINRLTADPLANARIGKARISADTGQ
ncbi:MAG TPA: prepilin-type N-terminal cleavage/methylation domain-containing protein [Gemmatales bacterium]|nr:prepilin-type N-terminal cleavage/methylation domain-containing protein [Gemmatales bacterium]